MALDVYADIYERQAAYWDGFARDVWDMCGDCDLYQSAAYERDINRNAAMWLRQELAAAEAA